MVARVAVHRMAIAVDRVETRVAVPRFVEMQPVDARAEQLLDARDVVARPSYVEFVTIACFGWRSANPAVSGFDVIASRIAACVRRSDAIGPMIP